MSQKIAISELLENAGSINDDDLLLLSKKTSGNNFKSTKLAGSVFKETVNSLISAKSSDFHRAAFPDWDDSKKVEITTNPWTVSGNGWVTISYKNTENTDNVGIKINNILVAGFFRGEYVWQDIQPAIIPVCDGDEITFDTEYSGEITSLLEMYFYPIRLVTEHGIIGNGGSGGVIDGTVLNNPSTDKVTWTAGSSVKKSYTVKNDCLLYCFFDGNEEMFKYTIDDTPLAFFWEVAGSDENFSVWIPVKSGSVIKTWHPTSENDNTVYPYTSDGQITFTEYKLNSIAPQIAMPDYSVTPIEIVPLNNSQPPIRATTETVTYTAPQNGWVIHRGYPLEVQTQYVSFTLEINDKLLSNVLPGYAYSLIYPVSKDDVIKATPAGSGYYVCNLQFYPCKSVVQDANSVIELLYPIGSIYLDASGSDTCPLSALIPGSTWSKIATKILASASNDIPVVGNGKAIGLTSSGSNTFGVWSNGGNDFPIFSNSAYNSAIGTDSGTTDSVTRGAIGIVNDPDKSGLKVDMSSVGISVNVWKRTA